MSNIRTKTYGDKLATVAEGTNKCIKPEYKAFVTDDPMVQSNEFLAPVLSLTKNHKPIKRLTISANLSK